MPAPDALLAAALVRDPAGPLLTFYDDSTGERTELSATSLANWVAKTANLLRDEVGTSPGDRVGVLLPAHWQTAAILLGAWTAAAVVSPAAEGAAAAFCTADRVQQASASDEVFALSLAPLGRGFGRATPPGARDYSVDVLAQGDRWSGRPVPDAVPALDTGSSTVTAGDLVEIALRRAAELGMVAGDRVLISTEWDSPTRWVDGLLVPLAAGASVVLVVNPAPDALPHRVEAERITATLGLSVPGVRPL
ncbi:MAG TPA: TIGR03089 family protein [Mycobacteriales bacterium]|nr:TIGR03089 family protein [Mycobacteriales bacterium]